MIWQDLIKCPIQDPRSALDDVVHSNTLTRHPEQSEGSPNTGTEPHSEDPSLCSG